MNRRNLTRQSLVSSVAQAPLSEFLLRVNISYLAGRASLLFLEGEERRPQIRLLFVGYQLSCI